MYRIANEKLGNKAATYLLVKLSLG